jgi:hypothetical protein
MASNGMLHIRGMRHEAGAAEVSNVPHGAEGGQASVARRGPAQPSMLLRRSHIAGVEQFLQLCIGVPGRSGGRE